MFGFNIKDEFGQPLYKQLSFEEFEEVVARMKAFACSQPPLDYEKAIQEGKENPKLSTDEIGPFVCFKGSQSLDAVKDYTKFIRLGYHALQITYFEMEHSTGVRIGQLTIVDNYKLPLGKDIVLSFIDVFFNYKEKNWTIVETPPNVAVVLQPVVT